MVTAFFSTPFLFEVSLYKMHEKFKSKLLLSLSSFTHWAGNIIIIIFWQWLIFLLLRSFGLCYICQKDLILFQPLLKLCNGPVYSSLMIYICCSIFFRRDIFISETGLSNGGGAGISSLLYLYLRDIKGAFNIICIFMNWFLRYWWCCIWVQNSDGTPWVWLCYIFFWACGFRTHQLADKAVGDCYEAYEL